MRDCLIHELLNKTNSIFRSYLGEFCFLTVLVVALGSQGDFWWLWGWQETVIGTHDSFGFSLALSKGWVLSSALFVLVSWSTWISGLRWVNLKSWGFHSEPLPIALGSACSPLAKVCWFRPLPHTGKCCLWAPEAFSWPGGSQRLQYQLLGYRWCPQRCLLGYCWLLLMCTRGQSYC